jgi:aspartyl protease family protein
MDGETTGRLFYLVLLLLAVGGYVMVEFRQRMGQTLRTAAAWGLIFIGVMAGYGLWNDLKTDIAPQQMISAEGQIEVPRAEDGHYYVTLTINGTPLQFMADTGATSMVLSNADARRLGIDLESLVYLGRAQTANGTVATARVELPEVELGPYRDTDFAAWVNQGEMEMSLLGMEYLSLYRMEIAGDRMILRR